MARAQQPNYRIRLADTLKLHGPPGERSATQAFALWSLGFRPFYLLAAIFASLSIALWGGRTSRGLADDTLSARTALACGTR